MTCIRGFDGALFDELLLAGLRTTTLFGLLLFGLFLLAFPGLFGFALLALPGLFGLGLLLLPELLGLRVALLLFGRALLALLLDRLLLFDRLLLLGFRLLLLLLRLMEEPVIGLRFGVVTCIRGLLEEELRTEDWRLRLLLLLFFFFFEAPKPSVGLKERNRAAIKIATEEMVKCFIVSGVERWGFYCEPAPVRAGAGGRFTMCIKTSGRGSPFKKR